MDGSGVDRPTCAVERLRLAQGFHRVYDSHWSGADGDQHPVGRRHWIPWTWISGIVLVANIVAVVMIPYALSAVTAQISTSFDEQVNSTISSPGGLSRDGEQITNIFAYNSNGNPLSGVQLFDQNGSGLSVRDGFGAGHQLEPGAVTHSATDRPGAGAVRIARPVHNSCCSQFCRRSSPGIPSTGMATDPTA